MGLLADTYEIDEDRDQAVGKAMSGVALGIMLVCVYPTHPFSF